MEKICEYVNITLNKNSVHGDTSAMNPGGVRIGTAALTTRNFKEHDFIIIAELLHETCQLALAIQESINSKLLKDFEKALQKNDRIKQLNNIIQGFSSSFYSIL